MTLHANNAAFAHRAAIRSTAQQLDDEIRRGNFSNDALIADLLFLILGPEDRRRVLPDRPLTPVDNTMTNPALNDAMKRGQT